MAGAVVGRREIGVRARRDRHPQNVPKKLQKKLSIRKFRASIPTLEVPEINMRYLLIVASVLLAFGATTTFESTEANAAVCARGVYRAGCAGARGAVVVRKPAVVCRTVVVNGVKVRRCT